LIASFVAIQNVVFLVKSMKKIIIFFGLTILMSIQLCHAEWYSISSNCNIQSTCTTLTGNYTIDKSLPTLGKNYHSFTEAIEALKCGGISGATIFYIASGTYDEQIRIPFIYGTSETDTITFTSESGNNTDVVLQSTIKIHNAAILFDSCSHIRFSNITVKNNITNNTIRFLSDTTYENT